MKTLQKSRFVNILTFLLNISAVVSNRREIITELRGVVSRKSRYLMLLGGLGYYIFLSVLNLFLYEFPSDWSSFKTITIRSLSLVSR